MWYCLGEALVLLVPPAGATMQGRDQRGGRLLQALAQGLGKQVMVAIPLPFVIEGDQEQVGTLQEVELCLAVTRCTNRIAQRSAQSIQNAGLQQEVLDACGLTTQ